MSESLRIAVVASSRYPIAQPFAGGLEAHVWHLTRALTLAGHEVTLFAGAGSDLPVESDRLRGELFEPSAAARSDVSMPPIEVLHDHHAYLSLMLSFTRNPDDFDVIHNHSLHYLPVAMGPAVDTPMVTTLHTPPTPWLESALALAPDTRCVAVSRHTAHAWSHVLGSIPVVHNGVQLNHWPIGTGGDDLVWFGRLVPEKGAHLAIEAARIAGRRLRLAGPISDKTYFRDHVAPALGDQVSYEGHLHQHELARLVGSCGAALVTPVWDEPYGLVVAESLACGTPVAGFARGGIPEIVGDTAGMLVPGDDVVALAEAAEKAFTIDRREVRRRAEQHCSDIAMIDRYTDIYTELVAERERRGSRRLAGAFSA
ncbi:MULTISPECIES: glycosyltransferase family 4 protein [Gordonia]|uniref:Glycosyltransferase family 4 protein n=1 Tax=Gordonia amicalis TaxID=89053 RepID=A0AAE4R1S7_9ACTN|nr:MULTISPECIES: glycosyltransferase family 4 protein [Gordonia]ATD72345.1 glycosyltransferase family 4 protein [Gordonia sp. 1D]MCZ4578590.1 glycosyltransferase family 4 protein [Gordonia amicalis]MCZ4651608.1 glycosyltransferase family 4 protein [Gordonia amicalis]MDJ0452641.1 glycosyltransferase family 4 protein [Gordonia amicalis]MDV6307785.1 glycosyltransferase family 4 protein [Gordonia amicalis]